MTDKQVICKCNDKECGQCSFEEQLKAKEQECERLKNDKFALELRLDELTSPVNVEDCEHSVFNGEYIACRYYEGQQCDDADFSNCMFRENVRLKQQLDQLKATNEDLLSIQYKLADNNKRLRQTLTEIMKIAYSDNHHFSGRTIFRYEVVDKILQKISECEVGNG